MHRPQIGRVLKLERDAFAQQPAQHLGQLADHRAEIEHARLHRLLAREGEQLAHKIGGADGVLVDVVDLAERGIAGLVPHQQELGIADDDGEQIVEVVRHAAGELTHGLHLLRLRELRLQRLLLGHVDQVDDNRLVCGMIGAAGIHLRHGVASAGRTDFDRRLQAAIGAGEQLVDRGTVGRLDQFRQVAAGRRLPAKECREGLIGGDDPAIGLDGGDADRRIL